MDFSYEQLFIPLIFTLLILAPFSFRLTSITSYLIRSFLPLLTFFVFCFLFLPVTFSLAFMLLITWFVLHFSKASILEINEFVLNCYMSLLDPDPVPYCYVTNHPSLYLHSSHLYYQVSVSLSSFTFVSKIDIKFEFLYMNMIKVKTYTNRKSGVQVYRCR